MPEFNIELTAKETALATTLVEYLNSTPFTRDLAAVDVRMIKKLATGKFSQPQAVRSYTSVVNKAARACVRERNLPAPYAVGPYTAKIRYALAALYAYSVVKHVTGQNVEVVA